MSGRLDARTMPLRGSRLIEASAGTGKTWTIAALYLRLVLGHGGAEAGYARPLVPSEILVMTYTRAATRELSDRVRTRLVEAVACFRGERSVAGDPLLAALLDDHPPGPSRDQAAWRLAAAAEAMDDAAVFTIDAWVQRMLREHAFDSGSLFDEVVQPDDATLVAEAARDYWREQVYPLTGAALDAVLAVWPNVDALVADLRELLKHVAHWTDDDVREPLAAVWARVQAAQAPVLAELSAPWPGRVREMRAFLEPHFGSAANPFSLAKLKPTSVTGWLDAIERWAASPEGMKPPVTDENAWRLSAAGLKDALKKGKTADIPDSFDTLAPTLVALRELTPAAHAMRRHAALGAADILQRQKARTGVFGFDDMLRRLDDALGGPGGERLRARIVAQYPAALIDEFQDTSPIQFRIFDRLYGIAGDDPATVLLLIGDPKQSIYGFRGADIHSYLRARTVTAGRHAYLGTNYRATAALVAAVNHLFVQGNALPAGAFRFGGSGGDAGAGEASAGEAGSGEAGRNEGGPKEAGRNEAGRNEAREVRANTAEAADRSRSSDAPAIGDGVGGAEAGVGGPLPFVPVDARGLAETFRTSAGAVAAMTLAHDAELASKFDAQRRFAEHAAEHIAAALGDDGAGFDGPGAAFRRLRPADVAVLVRDRGEAAAIRRALQRRRVPSVFLSDQNSVFASAEAEDLVHWLRAVAEPLDSRRARVAFATRLVGMRLAELAALGTDDLAFEARLEDLKALHADWRRQGVLPMLRATLHRLDLPARWLLEADGERRLTNFLHLAELLQAASAQLDGEQALIRWLGEQRRVAFQTGDEQVVRLESDADLVRVLTIHMAKGLEYPVVYLPFACSYREPKASAGAIAVLAEDDGSRSVRFDIAANDDVRRRATLESDQEDLRLLYVATTRAQHALWLGVAPMKLGQKTKCGFSHSAFGYLVSGGAKLAEGEIAARLHAVFDRVPSVAIEVVSGDAALTPLTLPVEAAPIVESPAYAADFERDWSIGSFSAFVRNLRRAPTGPVMVAPAVEEQVLEGADEVDTRRVAVASSAARHRFPRGALPGNFLHDQLEWLATQDFALVGDAALREQLLRRCEREGWGHRANDVATWLGEVVSTVLPPLGRSLDALPRVLPEMEFWFPSGGIDAAVLDGLCRRHLLDGRDRPPLPARSLSGMLMGFADLVCEVDGRYWVVDYKSNALGAGDADYDADALAASMAAHRYDVQAAVYLLALDRLLRQRLGAAYAPDRDLGGALYLFLRGVRGPEAGCFVVRPPRALIDGLDAAFRTATGAGGSDEAGGVREPLAADEAVVERSADDGSNDRGSR